MKNHLSYALALALLLCAALSVGSCSKSSSASSSSSSGVVFKPMSIAPVVNEALPAAYQASSTAVSKSQRWIKKGEPGVLYHKQYRELFQKKENANGGARTLASVRPLSTVTVDNTNSSVAATNIGYLFSNSFNDINNGSTEWQGYINNQIIQIDERMASGPMTVAMSCLSNTANAFTVDLSSIDPMLKFTLGQLQCYGTEGTTGNSGGMAWGQQGSTCETVAAQPTATPNSSPAPITSPTPFSPGSTSGGCNFSLWVSLSQDFTTNGGFMVYANLENAGSTTTSAPEYVDAMSLFYSPSTSNNGIQVTRLRAVPSLNVFEMYYAANQAGISNSQAVHWSYLGAGFRIISDGVHIYSDGKVYDNSAWESYDVCLNASDNSVADITNPTTLTDCNALANSFSLSSSGTADLTYYELTGVTSGTTIPGPEAQSSQTSPSTTVSNLMSTAFDVTKASSAATSGFSSGN